jgi:glycosyltransferase involved in cell wall biosynthesis
MFSAFTDGGRLPYMKIHGTLPFEYMDMFANADIMLIPLQESDWHGCKSNLKILEAAAKKIPVICSKVEPYSNDMDAPVFWVEKQSQWFEYLNLLINNPSLRETMGNALHEWAKKKYELTDINIGRRELYGSVCEA